MKMKFYKQSTAAAAALLAIGLTLSRDANAERFMSEDFSSCSLGGLYQQNGWVRHLQNDPVANLIPVTGYTLKYTGYSPGTSQKAAKIEIGTTDDAQEKLKKQFRDKSSSTDAVYYSFLMNLSQVPADDAVSTYFFSFMTANANSDA